MATVDRRSFVLGAFLGVSSLPLGLSLGCRSKDGADSEGRGSGGSPGGTGSDALFSISLAQWSLHKELQSGALDPMAFPAAARELGFEAVEFVNSFYRDLIGEPGFDARLGSACREAGTRPLLIMCDGLGYLGDADLDKRRQAVEAHKPWLDLAQSLGCHSIRVNAQSSGSREEQEKLAADGLRQLCELADPQGIDVLVENHGGLSSDGSWLSAVMRRVDHPRIGTLPDFGNFSLGDDETYDRYQGVAELMPFAKAVSAKSHDFDEAGDEIHTDYRRMLGIVLEAGYHGFIGVEYEGRTTPEREGIQQTKALLERVRTELAG